MREDGVNARQGARGGCVDAPDARMRERAPHERDVDLPRQREVRDELPLASEEAVVLPPAQRRPEPPRSVHAWHLNVKIVIVPAL